MRAMMPWDYGHILDKVEKKYGKEWFTWVEIEEFGIHPMQLGAMLRMGLLEKKRAVIINNVRFPTEWRLTPTGLHSLNTFRKRMGL